MTETPIDLAFAAMQAAPENEAARLPYYERLADSELFLLLEKEAGDDKISPELFETEEGRFVVAFDREERLVDFTGQPAPFVALSGRVIAHMLLEQGIGLGVNLGVEGRENLLDAEALGWLLDTLNHHPDQVEDVPGELSPPKGIPDVLLGALDRKLPSAVGLAQSAHLAAVRYKSGRRGHILAFLDALLGAEEALANSVSEALTFSGIEAGELDVVFLRTGDALVAPLLRVGMRFDLPQPQEPKTVEIAAPGSDPSKPPILR
ncbi:SseB family protein [Falsihalocynthiibacter sp. SS001]|uniref:SseB family protein n=1 Tax=Falsihalocynthiibacter sp. SS001 TaxID=3349698 RepID=UPI0036D40A55